MTNTPLSQRTQLPTKYLAHLENHPRADWEDNPEVPVFILQWLENHALYRRLSKTLVKETQRFLDKEHNAQEYAQRLGFFGAQLVENLTRHHNFENTQFFPTISAAEPSVEKAVELLIQDHATLTTALETFVIAGNEIIDLALQDDNQLPLKAATILAQATALQAFLTSQLNDEENLIIPILLHNNLAD